MVDIRAFFDYLEHWIHFEEKWYCHKKVCLDASYDHDDVCMCICVWTWHWLMPVALGQLSHRCVGPWSVPMQSGWPRQRKTCPPLTPDINMLHAFQVILVPWYLLLIFLTKNADTYLCLHINRNNYLHAHIVHCIIHARIYMYVWMYHISACLQSFSKVRSCFEISWLYNQQVVVFEQNNLLWTLPRFSYILYMYCTHTLYTCISATELYIPVVKCTYCTHVIYIK